jgi:hypothetical protein
MPLLAGLCAAAAVRRQTNALATALDRKVKPNLDQLSAKTGEIIQIAARVGGADSRDTDGLVVCF